MKNINATQARQNFYGLIDEAVTHNEIINISSKKGNAVLLSASDWQAIQETLYLISIPNMRESIIEGLNTSLDDCEEMNWEVLN